MKSKWMTSDNEGIVIDHQVHHDSPASSCPVVSTWKAYRMVERKHKEKFECGFTYLSHFSSKLFCIVLHFPLGVSVPILVDLWCWWYLTRSLALCDTVFVNSTITSEEQFRRNIPSCRTKPTSHYSLIHIFIPPAYSLCHYQWFGRVGTVSPLLPIWLDFVCRWFINNRQIIQSTLVLFVLPSHRGGKKHYMSPSTLFITIWEWSEVWSFTHITIHSYIIIHSLTQPLLNPTLTCQCDKLLRHTPFRPESTVTVSFGPNNSARYPG